MQKKHILFISFVHLFLVIFNLAFYGYEQTADAENFVFVADELTSFNYGNLDPLMNCFTAPGYPLFLSLIKPITFHNYFIIAILQSILFCFSIYFLLNTLVKKNFITPIIAIVSFSIVLFLPDVFEANGATLSESFTASLLLLQSGILISGFEKKYEGTFFIIISCFLFLTKFEYLVLLLPILYRLLKIKKYQLSFSLLISLFLVFSLNGIKNYSIFGEWNFFSYGAGKVIYGGNNLNGDASWHVDGHKNYIPKDEKIKYDEIMKKSPDCICTSLDSLYKKMAFNAWQQDWIYQMKLIPIKFLKLWLLPAGMDIYTAKTEYSSDLYIGELFDDTKYPWYAKYKHGFYLFVYWIFILAAIFGVFIKKKQSGWSRYDYHVFSVLLLITILFSIPFYGIGRFHAPLIGLLGIYSAISILYLDKKWMRSFLEIKLKQKN